MRIRVVTDTGSSLSAEQAARLGILLVPLGVQIDGAMYREGRDITPEEFYRIFPEASQVSTSQPSPGDFLEIYDQLKDADAIISVHITGKASGTVGVAKMLQEQSLKGRLHVVDSESVTMGTGFLAMAAARGAQEGKSLHEILRHLDDLKTKILGYAAVPTLKYLARSGRIPKAKALLAGVLAIKPVLEIQQGVVDVSDRVRSYPKAVSRTLEKIVQHFGSEVPLRVSVLHTQALAEAEAFAQKIRQSLHVRELFFTEMGVALACHGGQGMLGIMVSPE